jgi:hypothetical protein
VRLIIEDLEGATTVINLGGEDVTIGRTPSNTIQLTEQNVSRSHAKLVVRDDGWFVEDLGSYNGVRVNGVEIDGPTLLRERDLIQIGDYHLTLTDQADRATVDIGHPPAAANDSMATAMASSADLPSVSVEELPPARGAGGATGGAAGGHRTTSTDKSSKVGLIVGILGVVLAVGGVSLWLIGGNNDRSGSKPAVADASPGTHNEQPSAPPEPEPDAMVAPDPLGAGTETAGDSAAIAEAADEGTDSDPVIEDDAYDSGTETETGAEALVEDPDEKPAPAPKPVAKPKPKAESKSGPPKLPPDEALAAARKASLTGNNKQAYALAKDAYDQNKSSEALSVMGVAACKMRNENKAKAAYKKMSSKDKQTLEKICEPLGIEF